MGGCHPFNAHRARKRTHDLGIASLGAHPRRRRPARYGCREMKFATRVAVADGFSTTDM